MNTKGRNNSQHICMLKDGCINIKTILPQINLTDDTMLCLYVEDNKLVLAEM